MWWWGWGPGWGWIGGVAGAVFWIVIIVLAVLLLRRELPALHARHPSSALRLLEERYARGEIGRDEFLQRRAVLLQSPMPPPPPPGGDTDQTQPLPPAAP